MESDIMKRSNRSRMAMWAAWLLMTAASAPESRAGDPATPPGPPALPTSRGAIEPPAPVLPADVVAAMQDARYDDARRVLVVMAERAADADDRAYFSYLRAVTERLAGRRDAARDVLRSAMRIAPSSRWVAKIRYELAGIELADGNLAAAEELARGEAVRLLAADRKDRLAEVYHAFAVRLLQPDDPVVRPDPNAAYELLEQARDLAKSPALRARFLDAMGRASLAANNPARALQNFEAYRSEFPAGVDRFEVRLRLAEAQRKLNQLLSARLTWSDLARDIERLPAPELKPELAAIRATALYEIASTYGIPNPPDDTRLNLGVAALRRFLAAAPAHPKAVRAAYTVGAAYLARGKGTEAFDALTRFIREDGFKIETDEASREWAELSMTASFQVAQILQGQQRYREAIAAWKGYLARFPNGPQSADAQRETLNTQLLIAADHLNRGHFAEARAAWSEFTIQNPLDERVPAVLFQVGQSYEKEKQFDRAIAAWETLAGKFPNSEPAAHGQFQAGTILETDKGELSEAIERFKKITVEPWKSQAQQRIAVMESKQLLVITPRTFRSGEAAQLQITTRNIENLRFTAYKLNAESYFRSKEMLGGVESLDIGLVAPDAAWTAPVPGYARYKPVEAKYDLKNLELPGVYAVKVTDEKTLQAITLVIGSDLDAIVKMSSNQVLVFAQDMKAGRGRAGARVLIADGQRIVLEAKTGPDGVLLHTWEPALAPNHALSYLVLDEPHVAGSSLATSGQVAQGLSPRAYIYTDRPAYRPGQAVSIRGVVREVREGQYASVPKAVYRFEVADSRGRLIAARPVTLSDFGTFHESLPLDTGAPLGTYRITVSQPGKSVFNGSFNVQSYQLEPIALNFDLKKNVVYRGEMVQGDIVARYQYGEPLASRPIEASLPDGRTLHGMTDAAGKYHLEFSTEGFAEEQILRLTARLPQDNVSETATVRLALRGFEIGLSTTRDVYLDGEPFALQVVTTDALGQPIGASLSATLVKQVTVEGRVTERDVTLKAITTDAQTGRASLTFRADDTQGGMYVLRVAGTDRFGTPIVADRAIAISGKKDETKLRLLADRVRFKVGEEASVNLHSRSRAGTALLTWEADRVLSYRVVSLKDGDNALAWNVDNGQFPNFTLTSTRMWENQLDEARLDIQAERDLRVTVKPARPSVGPGEPIELDITTVDQLGRPVSAELSIAMIDQSLLRLYGDRLPEIGSFFYNQTRTGAFATEATNTFRYEPNTTGVPLAVVDEAERGAAMAANAADRANVMGRAQGMMMGMMGNQGQGQQGQGQGQQGPGGNQAPPAPSGFADSAARSEPNDRRAGKHTTFAAVNPAQAGIPVAGVAEAAPAAEPAARGESMEEKLGEGEKDKKASTSLPLREILRSRSEGLNKAAQPRERFVESAYWNPSVVTAKDGRARVTFKAPAALSEYRITARGVTGADTLAGQTTAALTVKKSFFVDMKLPASLTQGDKPRFVAQVHHTGVRGALALRLATYAGGRDDVFPKALELKGDGVDEVVFEPYEVPEGDSLRLTLSAAAGEARDELIVEVPIRPWGVPVYASASGTSGDSTTVFIGLPAGRNYDGPDMLITLSPTVQRMLVELALGRDVMPLRDALLFDTATRCLPPPTNTTADRAAELLAATSVLGYLRDVRAAAPEAQRLTERIQGLVTELIAAQNQDGGWPWVTAGLEPMNTPNRPPGHPSDRLTSAAVFWALASAERLGLLSDPRVLDHGASHLDQEFARLGASEWDTRAAMLHALSTRRAASFEAANSLNRARNDLSDSALAYLALIFANLDRPTMATELVGILGPRGKSEPTAPGRPSPIYWDRGRAPFARSVSEITALVTLAYARVKPDAQELDCAVDWLTAHRVVDGWLPHKAKGPALAALASYYGRARGAEDRYRLTVTVNEAQVAVLDVQGPTEGKVIAVPRAAIKIGQPNAVRFAMEGRGRFGFAAVLSGFTREFGPDQNRANRFAWVEHRAYYPAAPELDGKTLPVGFTVAINPTPFENLASQVALGGRARVALTAYRNARWNTREWESDFLVVEEHLPAGTTMIEGSLSTQASSFEVAGGVLTLYFPPGANPGVTTYDVFGYVPGQYRALPASVRSAYEPGRFHLGQPADFRVRQAGEPNADPYKPTPDELYASGKAHFDAGRFAEAAEVLEPLFGGYTLRDDIAKDSARMLLLISIRQGQPRKIVQYFEVVKEKSPELVLGFDQLLAIGSAYRDIKEYERATIVWRGLIEASYLEDARIGELLRQRGQTLEAMAYLLNLWRSYPETASIESDFFGLSQVLVQAASRAFTDARLRGELASAGITRSQLLLESIRIIQTFLARSPRNPMADEASLALVGAFTELEDFQAVVRLSDRFARAYPKSSYLDNFQYSEALGDFHLGQYDRAIEVAGKIARATYKDAAGADQPSPNKWQAIYILGQIHDARRQPARALEYYRQVADRFSDAAGAIQSYTRKELKMPEVTVIRPDPRPAVASGPPGGLRAIAAAGAPGDVPDPATVSGVTVNYRNIAQVDVKVYPVDLMQLYLTRRNLNDIAGIDLAGITPMVDKTVALGSGADFEEKKKRIELPMTKEGAYLVMIRGENLHASGIVLVSPLEIEVTEEDLQVAIGPGATKASPGVVRVTIRDCRTKDFLPKVEVKVIGSADPQFLTGQTDLRGVFVAEGWNGVITVLARRDSSQYAFYRGTRSVAGNGTFGGPTAPALGGGAATINVRPGQQGEQSLDANIKMQNESNSIKQIERLQQRYFRAPNQAPGAAAGEFH
jgi:tetratricopeptide (TPR) repeat protein